jgi:hypothetical protein
VLDHLQAQHEWPAPELAGEVVVGRAGAKVETVRPGVGDAFARWIDAGNLKAFGSEQARGGAIAAAEIEHPPRPAISDAVRENPAHRRPEVGVRAGGPRRGPSVAGRIDPSQVSAAERRSRFCHRPLA